MPGNFDVEKANTQLSAEAIGQDPSAFDRLREPGTLVPFAQEFLGLSDDTARYLADFSPRLLEGTRAAVIAAVDAGRSVHVNYVPAYDFEVRLFEYGNATVVSLQGPYPGQDYPSAIYNATRSG
jgi:hypothetical protein